MSTTRPLHWVGLGLVLLSAAGVALAGDPAPDPEATQSIVWPEPPGHFEVPRDAPARSRPIRTTPALPSARLAQPGFWVTQVNVTATGGNILGDAANEPTIAVNFASPMHIVMGWRQFDSVSSDYRKAGYAYSQDGGHTWTFPGTLDSTFRSDPVLNVDAEGNFFYANLKVVSNTMTCDVFKSTNGGITWAAPVFAYGGDKEWMTIDRTTGIGHDNQYLMWSSATGTYYVPYAGTRFLRSVNGGQSFEPPYDRPMPVWGTLSVGPDGTLYAGGIASPTFQSSDFRVVISTNAKDPLATPTFDEVEVDMGGMMRAMMEGPNPGGLNGQAWIVADRSGGATNGYVYMLCSVTAGDPLDVHFIRSTDGGQTWSAPVRVNDDSPNIDAYQWFGALDVAPSGRLDAVWCDTRHDRRPANPVYSEIYYAYSLDAGVTWSPNQQVTQPFNHFLGYPAGQSKIGDYLHVVSDNAAANVAFAATFNGEEDVYYARLGDCNNNGVHDGVDIANGTSADCTGNGIPDECEPDCNNNGIADSCDIANGTSQDCTGNGIPDECEPDCNSNGIADSCDIANGTSVDCNRNGVPDDCDIATGTSFDVNGDGIPDECAACQPEATTKLLAGDGAANDDFGYAVALAGDVAVIGARRHQNAGVSTGAAYVYRRVGKVWTQEARLLASDGAASDNFGASVAISGDVVVVGAWGVDGGGGTNSGAAYVFRRQSGGTWVQEAKLLVFGSNPPTLFGWSVAVVGDMVIVGAELGQGGAYVFRHSGKSWVADRVIRPHDSDSYSIFGCSLSLAGQRLIVGAARNAENGNYAGAAYVFHCNPDGTWTEEAKLMAPVGQIGAYFGNAVALSGNVAVVGAYWEDSGHGYNAGGAYVFRYAAGMWGLETRLETIDGAPSDQFGVSVAVNVPALVPDSAFVAVGANGAEAGGVESGVVNVYEYNGDWFRAAQLTPDNPTRESFGAAVALADDTLLIGANTNATLGSGAGAAYVVRALADCNGNDRLDICDIATDVLTDLNGNGYPDQCEGLGDCNCDGVLDFGDINYFVAALQGEAYWRQYYAANHGGQPPPCSYYNADCNGDGLVNSFDINPFVELLSH